MRKIFVSALLLVIVFVIMSLLINQHMMSQTQYRTTLLTVNQDDETVGGVAELYLEVRPGSGRVFINSFPVSRTDTQFSTRFANQIACDFLEADCSRYDFLYTINAGSSIVGGPSAGAAMTVLTVAALDRQPLRQDVAMTGTINSGGLIGPVAGVPAKAQAAQQRGINTVVAPVFSSLRQNNSQDNISLHSGFSLVRASDLYEALPYFIEKEYLPSGREIVAPQSYKETMNKVADLLCSRFDALSQDGFEQDEELLERIQRGLLEERFYSTASLCFGGSIDAQQNRLSNLSEEQLRILLVDIRRELMAIDQEISNKSLVTIADVETQAIVRERVVEARQAINEINTSNISPNELAFIIERSNSARAWSEFFGIESDEFIINTDHLRFACSNKISEAEERVTYIEGFLPDSFTQSAREQLQLARRDQAMNEYSVCLFKASKAKAEANILISAISVSEDQIEQLAREKLRAAERVLSRQADRGLFPIMGYSYFEYAHFLIEEDPISALRFAEYALEVSNLHLYFPQETNNGLLLDWQNIGLFVVGLLTGFSALLIMVPGRTSSNKRRGSPPGKKR